LSCSGENLKENTVDDKANPVWAFVVGLFGLMLKFAACDILTIPVALTFGAAMIAYLITFGPEIPILQYLSDVLPIDSSGSITLDKTDVMRIYTLVTGGLLVLSLLGKGLLWGLRQLIKKKSRSEVKRRRPIQNAVVIGVRRFVVSTVVITAINLTLFIALPFANNEGTSLLVMYLVAGPFYVVAVLMNTIYIMLDSYSDYMMWWAISNVTWWFTWRPDRN
jgi:hypothetical protein